MTEKRFEYWKYADGTECIRDRKKDRNYWENSLSVIEELLNALYDENEQLKSDLQYWKTLAQSLAKQNNVGGFE